MRWFRAIQDDCQGGHKMNSKSYKPLSPLTFSSQGWSWQDDQTKNTLLIEGSIEPFFRFLFNIKKIILIFLIRVKSISYLKSIVLKPSWNRPGSS